MNTSGTQLSITIVDKNHSAIDTAYPLEKGQSLLKNLMLNGIKSHSKCGGKAICSNCKIQVISGNQYCNKPVAEEKIHLSELQLKHGWRLACQLFCLKDISVYLPTKDEI